MIKTEGFAEFRGDAKGLSPLALAFVGDGVFELLVRGHLIEKHTVPVKKLHRQSVEMVNAEAQSKAYNYILDQLSESERDIMRRGRNATITRMPKSSSVEDYHKATGVEALFGYLYLDGQTKRLVEVFTMILESFLHKPSI